MPEHVLTQQGIGVRSLYWEKLGALCVAEARKIRQSPSSLPKKRSSRRLAVAPLRGSSWSSTPMIQEALARRLRAAPRESRGLANLLHSVRSLLVMEEYATEAPKRVALAMPAKALASLHWTLCLMIAPASPRPTGRRESLGVSWHPRPTRRSPLLAAAAAPNNLRLAAWSLCCSC